MSQFAILAAKDSKIYEPEMLKDELITPFIHYLVAETGGLLDSRDFQTWRLLHASPQPYTRERFEDTYKWTAQMEYDCPGRDLREYGRQSRVDLTRLGIVALCSRDAEACALRNRESRHTSGAIMR
jgi:hypothetical protein